MKLINNKNNYLIFFVLLTSFPILVKSQNDLQKETIQKVLTTYSQQEKAYVHTDRNYYNVGETIFFKIYLTDMDLSLAGAKSKVMYVELINNKNQIIDRKKIALENGRGIGNFKLNNSLERGKYLFRAYTKLLQQHKEYRFFRKAVFINSIHQSANEILVDNDVGVSNKEIDSGNDSNRKLLTISLLEENKLLKIKGKSTANQNLNGGIIVAFIKGNVVWKEVLKRKSFDFDVPLSTIPNGIVQFLVLNSRGELIDDTSIFNIYSSGVVNAKLSSNKKIDINNPEISFLLKLYDKEGTPVPADLSVAVIEQQYVTDFSTSGDISSHLLFDSWNSYNTANSAKTSLDFVNVPQDRFQWKEILDQKTSLSLYTPEIGLSIKGYVTENERTDKPVKAIGYLATLQNDFSMHSFETNEQGQFNIEGLSFNGEKEFFIQAVKSKNKNKTKVQATDKMVLSGNRNVTIHLLPEEPVLVTQQDSVFLSDSEINFLKKMPPPVESIAGTLSVWDGSTSIDLEEVSVTTEKINQTIDYYERGMMYKEPDTRITTEAMPLEQYLDIYSVLAGKVAGMRIVGVVPDKQVIIRGMSSITGNNAAQFMLNGVPIDGVAVQSIIPANIAFVDVIKSLHKLAPYGELGANGLVLIYLKPPGQQIKRKQRTVDGILNFTMKGYDMVKEPVRNPSSTEKNTPTVFWNPMLKTDSFGEALIAFNTPNKAGIYELIIEGLSNKGLPVLVKAQLTIQNRKTRTERD